MSGRGVEPVGRTTRSIGVRPWLLAVCCALVAASCGTFGAGAMGDLQGRTFLSTGVTENGQNRALVAGTRIRLFFPKDRSAISVSAGCNTIGGDARIDGGRLVVTQLGMTDMACDPARMGQDDWLAKFLSDGPAIAVGKDDLVLTRGTTQIRLLDREVADPDRPLVATRWNVESLVSGDVTSSVPAGTQAHLIFAADGTLSGSDGCNLVSGGAKAASGTIHFADIVTTKMACEPDRARLEAAVLAVLREGDVAYEVEADLLRLRAPGGVGLDLRAAP